MFANTFKPVFKCLMDPTLGYKIFAKQCLRIVISTNITVLIRNHSKSFQLTVDRDNVNLKYFSLFDKHYLTKYLQYTKMFCFSNKTNRFEKKYSIRDLIRHLCK
jgi:hypothetical protein